MLDQAPDGQNYYFIEDTGPVRTDVWRRLESCWNILKMAEVAIDRFESVMQIRKEVYPPNPVSLEPFVVNTHDVISRWAKEQFRSRSGFAIWYPNEDCVTPELESILVLKDVFWEDNQIVIVIEDGLARQELLKSKLKESRITFTHYQNGEVVEQYQPTY